MSMGVKLNKESYFLAQETYIEIIPHFGAETFEISKGNYGPFIAMVPIKVPIWVALELSKRGYCEIQIPRWLNEKSLELSLEDELNDQKLLSPLPFYWEEILSMLIGLLNDNSRMICQRIKEVRQSKILKYYGKIEKNGVILGKICSNELNQFLMGSKIFFKFLDDVKTKDVS